MTKNTERIKERPILREKDIVRLYMEGLMKERGEKLRKMLELSSKRESLMIVKFKRSEEFI